MTTKTSGRPFRFLLFVMAGWVMLRLFSPGAVSYWPTHQPISNLQGQVALADTSTIAPQALLGASAIAALRPFMPATVMRRQIVRGTTKLAVAKPAIGSLAFDPAAMPSDPITFIRPTMDAGSRDNPMDVGPSGLLLPTVGPPPLLTVQKTTDRWRASSWIMWRPGGTGGNAITGAGRLGGSQAGFRMEYELAPRSASRLVAYGRLTSAFAHPAAPESAVGLAIQPIRAVPISIAVERRIALGKGARNANTIMAVGGFGPTVIAPAIAAEGYAQAGVVGFERQDSFIDGKLALSTRLSHTPFRLGAALSGGAQPGISRLDIGPELQIRLPLPQMGTRILVEWRERIAGDASPGSGLAITLAADF